MKQIIVNVSGLSEEEKQRVNEALAKIKGVRMCYPPCWDKVSALHGPSVAGVHVGHDDRKEANQTHTPQQVLEMAGMEDEIKFVYESAGSVSRITMSGSPSADRAAEALRKLGKAFNQLKSNAGEKDMKNNSRKVRADFDPKQSISVDVSNCTGEEKKEVQQAFFDVGIKWKNGCETYRHLGESQYSNTYECGEVSSFLMMSSDVSDCNMTPTEFLELVYEPAQQGHVHADLMALYAEDALTNPEPWKLWQIKAGSSDWISCKFSPAWDPCCEFRRKPKTHIVHGVEVPDLRFVPKKGDRYYLADPTGLEFTHNFMASNDSCDTMWAERGLCYEPTEEGKKAAILHAKAWLGIA